MSKGKACSNKNMNTILCILIVVLFLIAVWYVVFGNKSKEGFEDNYDCIGKKKIIDDLYSQLKVAQNKGEDTTSIETLLYSEELHYFQNCKR